MCLIIHKPKGKRIPRDIISKAKFINPHGFGITYLDSGKTYRTLSYKRVHALVNTDREIVCHFRLATVGKINISNVHPFHINDNHVIYSNGTVKGYGSTHDSDIAYIAKNVLPKLRKRDWVSFLELTDTRFAIVDTNRRLVNRVGHWHNRNGVYYSKNNCFALEPKTRVGVYGTLKEGFGNHHLLESSEFVANATTVDEYPLLVNGLPYLYDKKGVGEHVHLEIYDVDNKTLAKLDSLEGHPTFYERRKIMLSLDDWSRTEAWVYFINKDLPRNTKRDEMHYNYIGDDFMRNNAWYNETINIK